MVKESADAARDDWGGSIRRGTNQPAHDTHGACATGETSAPFDIATDPRRRFLHLVFHGLWDDATFASYAAAYLRAIEDMNAQGGIDYLLADGRTFGIQPIDITERFAELIERTRQLISPRTACVIPALVNRVQARPAGEHLRVQTQSSS